MGSKTKFLNNTLMNLRYSPLLENKSGIKQISRRPSARICAKFSDVGSVVNLSGRQEEDTQPLFAKAGDWTLRAIGPVQSLPE